MNRKIRTRFALGLSAFLLAAVGNAQASYPGQNGQIAFERGGAIRIINPDGTGERLLTPGYQPDWSPDGKKIAFRRPSALPNTGRNFGDIFTINATGSGLKQLTSDGHWSDPAWSPDGTRIAASYNTGTTLDVRIINAIDGSLIGVIAGSVNGRDVNEYQPAWKPDGQEIAYAGAFAGEGNEGIWVERMNADGAEGKQRLTSGAWHVTPDWSPDGSRLVFAREDYSWGIFVKDRNLATAPRLIVSGAAKNPSWSPDGNKVAYEWNSRIYTTSALDGSYSAVPTYVTSGQNPDWQIFCPQFQICLPKG
jgi:Tol biopolymer transport system component